jgi:hypothetical protein
VPYSTHLQNPLLLCGAALLLLVVGACDRAAHEGGDFRAATNAVSQPHPAEVTIPLDSDPFHVDRIFKSMRGPRTNRQVVVGEVGSPELVWLTGYSVEAISSDDETSDLADFICHTNLNFAAKAQPEWAKRPRPRIFTLTPGQTDVRLPAGFGMPIISTEKLTFNSQVLNLNQPEIDREVIHRAQVRYVPDRALSESMKPLAFTALQGYVTLEEEARVWNAEAPEGELEGASCAVGDHATKRAGNIVADGLGKRFSPHWVVPPGRHEYRTLVTDQLALPFDSTVHFIGVHVHPHSESLELRDLTTGETVFKSYQQNHPDRLGLAQVDYFSSEAGVPIYQDHHYEMISTYDNPTDRDGDAMAGMYIYYLDTEFDERTAGLPRAGRGRSAGSL